jgi:hypothetical protein
MACYEDLLEHQRKNGVVVSLRNKQADNSKISSSPEGDDILGVNTERNEVRCRVIPETIRELLKRLVEQCVTIILDAEEEPERVEVEAVVGDLLVAETVDHKFKFVDIRCICAVIVDREALIEGLLGTKFRDERNENVEEEKNPKKW